MAERVEHRASNLKVANSIPVCECVCVSKCVYECVGLSHLLYLLLSFAGLGSAGRVRVCWEG